MGDKDGHDCFPWRYLHGVRSDRLDSLTRKYMLTR
jgi:hypothetical protein